MHTPIFAVGLLAESARAARFGLYPIWRATSKIRWRVSSLMPPRPCRARSTVPLDTFAMSAIRWVPVRLFIIAVLSYVSWAVYVPRIGRDSSFPGPRSSTARIRPVGALHLSHCFSKFQCNNIRVLYLNISSIRREIMELTTSCSQAGPRFQGASGNKLFDLQVEAH